jgi:hypothetical protein
MPEIEFVTLANHAEAINGLLYLQGVGWTDIFQPWDGQGRPGNVHFGMAVSILIDWNETNRRWPFVLQIVHEDGGDPLARVEAQVEAGRPPGLPRGSKIRSVMAVGANIQFPQPGGYVLRGELGEQTREVAFRVNQALVAPGQFGS